MSSSTRRGFSLIELMTIVAVIGMIASLAVTGIVSAVRVGRVNGSAGVLTRMLVDARVRSMVQHCPHFVQINGIDYAPTSPEAGAPIGPGTISLVRKMDCASVDSFFRAGADPSVADRVLLSGPLGDQAVLRNGVRLYVGTPAEVELTSGAIAIGYAINGGRTYAVGSAAGVFGNDGSAGTFALRIASSGTDSLSDTVSIPSAGVATR
jgi:prepilin-type N-terminal cleavage/methylation domain-containing protein